MSHDTHCAACGAPDARLCTDYELPLCAACAEQRRQRMATYPVLPLDAHQRAGAEPWEWRPPRRMRLDDGTVGLGQPPPPTHVKGSRCVARPERRRLRLLDEKTAEQRYLERYLAQLTAEQQAPLRLQLQGLGYAEICARLGLKLVTVRERLRRARASLRALAGP